MIHRTVSAVLLVAFSIERSPAAVPVEDAAQLTQHSLAASATVTLVPVTKARRQANGGVSCAVTTGQPSDVIDLTVRPQAGAGTRLIKSYAPDVTAVPTVAPRGAAHARRTLLETTGNVVAGLDASRATFARTGNALRKSGETAGTAPTVMGAFDINSAARLRNAMLWNGTIGSANLWVAALNAMNLASAGDASRAATGMRARTPSTVDREPPKCPAGMQGRGTGAEPCRPAPQCPSFESVPADPSCAPVSGAGNVSPFLSSPSGVEPAVRADPADGFSASDVAAALARIQFEAR